MTIRCDPSLLPEIRQYGNFDTNACLQCGSCTVACDLTNDAASFPRRTLRYALLGLKEPLLRSLDPWLCYYCGDCSTTCPRQAEPGEAMMTLRRYLTTRYDWTGLSSKIGRSKAWHLGALSFVGVLVLALIVLYHTWVVGFELTDFVSMPMGLEHMFGTIYLFTLAVFLIPLAFLLVNALRMIWFTMRTGTHEKIPFLLYLRQAKTLAIHAATQMRFRDCADKWPWLVHSSLVVGCVLMFFLLVFLQWFQTDNLYPIYHPQRWLGYLATAALTFGASEILLDRIRRHRSLHKFSELTDWTFPILLLLTALSGILIHICRYIGLELTTHYMYALHLVIAVPLLLVEIPFGKWSHMFYRPLALYLQSVKEAASEAHAQKEEILDQAA